MERTEKCYHYFIGLSILFGISFIIVLLRLSSGVQNHSQNDLYNILLSCKYSLMVGFVLSVSITIALKCILDDLQWTLARLEVDTETLNEKMRKLENDK